MVTPVFLLVLVVGAEKKIELQDIEEDNLKSEKQKDYDTSDPRTQNSGPGPGSVPLDFLKNGFFRYFDNSVHQPTLPPRFVHQYAVTEAPEQSPPVQPKLYSPPSQQPQQALVSYLSNVPMQIYLVPQYYNEVDQGTNGQTRVQFTTGGQYTAASQHTHGSARVAGYSTAPEAVQSQTNYIEVPTYVAPTVKTYVPQYTPAPVTYVSYNTQPQVSPAPTVAPVIAYQLPVQYPTAVAPQPAIKGYYQNTRCHDTNVVEEHECDDGFPKQHTQTDVSYSKAPTDYSQYYSAKVPPRDEYRHNQIQELPHPSSLLLKGAPSHLSHIPKALPMYRPLNKPVYRDHPPHGVLAGRPNDHYGHFKRRPTSLLDSYVPSSLQIEYMKRGFTNDPLQAYEALSSGHHFSHVSVPRHFERGFLPNQMYHTASGGVTFGHYKRTPKVDKVPHK